MFTAKVEPDSTAVVFGLGGIGLNVIQGLKMIGARQIVGVDMNPEKRAIGEKFGMTHFVNPKDHDGHDGLVGHLVELTGGGAGLHVRVHRQRGRHARGARVLPQGLGGESVIIGVAGAGKEIATRPFQLVTGRVWRGSAFGGARGADGRAAHRRHVHGRAHRHRQPDHAQDAAREDQRGVRPDALGGIHHAASSSSEHGERRDERRPRDRIVLGEPRRAADGAHPPERRLRLHDALRRLRAAAGGGRSLPRALVPLGADLHVGRTSWRSPASRGRRQATGSSWWLRTRARAARTSPTTRPTISVRGAGFYLTATEAPWAAHYRMDRYVVEELGELVAAHFPVDTARMGILGHSMGGHGALTLHLKHPERYRSVSAFAPDRDAVGGALGREGVRGLPRRRPGRLGRPRRECAGAGEPERRARPRRHRHRRPVPRRSSSVRRCSRRPARRRGSHSTTGCGRDTTTRTGSSRRSSTSTSRTTRRRFAAEASARRPGAVDPPDATCAAAG